MAVVCCFNPVILSSVETSFVNVGLVCSAFTGQHEVGLFCVVVFASSHVHACVGVDVDIGCSQLDNSSKPLCFGWAAV